MYSITAAHNENTDTVMASTMCAIRNTNKGHSRDNEGRQTWPIQSGHSDSPTWSPGSKLTFWLVGMRTQQELLKEETLITNTRIAMYLLETRLR